MSKKKILLLESKTDRADSLRRRLRRLGYEVISTTAADVVRKTAEFQPAMVLIGVKPGHERAQTALAAVLKSRFKTAVMFLASQVERNKLLHSGQFSPAECVTSPQTDKELQKDLETARRNNRARISSPLEDKSWCHSVVCSIRDAVIATDNGGMAVFLNPAAEKMTGWTLADATGRPLSEIFKATSEEKGRPINVSFKRITRKRVASLPERMVLSTRSGTEKHVESSVATLSDTEGRPVGVVLVFRDVTERYLMAKGALARQKMEAIGTLAHGIAHDFGRLIGTIDAQAASLSDSLLPKTRAHDAAMTIIATTKEARELTSHLRDLAQASEPRAQGEIVPVDTAQVIADAAKVLEKTLAEHRIAFCADAPGKMPFVRANTSQLLDSLICVFLNSVDAMPHGGTLTVSVSTRNFKRIAAGLNTEARKGRYAILRITDTGHGMNRETLSHMFEPFFTTKQPGLVKGLGLTIVHGTILSWGGWITVHSAPKKGTTVALHIPAASVPVSVAAGDRVGGETILVIDDNDSDLALCKQILEENGYHVHVAVGGSAGLDVLHSISDNIDLVIIDLIMPQMDGRAVFKQIMEQDPGKSVIITSGFSRDYARSHLGQGGWGFVQKPIEKDQLLHAVARALEQRVITEGGADPAKTEDATENSQKQLEGPSR
jgi:two-component system, cell cycle sensor histidine kinase and response regulator CckA